MRELVRLATKWLWRCSLIVVCCISAKGTQVIMHVSRGRIIIAADSLMRHEGTSETLGCKIEQANGMFWASAGLDGHVATGYSVKRLIDTAAANRSSIRAILDVAGERLVPSLQKELPRIKRELPWFYQGIMQGGTILSVFAARETKVGLEGYAKEFRVSADRVTTEPARTCDRTSGCLLYSGRPELTQYLHAHPLVWQGDDRDVLAIERMMEVAIKAAPETIGPPISILQIAPNNTHWLRQNNCANIVTERNAR